MRWNEYENFASNLSYNYFFFNEMMMKIILNK